MRRASPPRIEAAVVVGGNVERARRDARREETGVRERRIKKKNNEWEKGCPAAEANCGRPRLRGNDGSGSGGGAETIMTKRL